MDESEITTAFEYLISEAMKGNPKALALLIEHSHLRQLLREVSGVIASRYRRNRDDLLQLLWLAIWTKIQTLQHPRSLKKWLYSIAENYCKNRKKHEEVMGRHREDFIAASIEGKRHRGESVQLLPLSTVITPEQEFFVNEGLRRVGENLSPEAAKVFGLWVEGLSAREIAEITCKSVKTIHPILKKFEREIVEESGIRPLRKAKVSPTAPERRA